MKLLDLKDLDVDPKSYKVKQVGVREWFLESLQYYPETFSEVSRKTKVNYRSLLKFSSGKQGLSFKNLLAVANYVKSLMNSVLSDSDLEGTKMLDSIDKEQFFNG